MFGCAGTVVSSWQEAISAALSAIKMQLARRSNEAQDTDLAEIRHFAVICVKTMKCFLLNAIDIVKFFFIHVSTPSWAGNTFIITYLEGVL